MSIAARLPRIYVSCAIALGASDSGESRHWQMSLGATVLFHFGKRPIMLIIAARCRVPVK